MMNKEWLMDIWWELSHLTYDELVETLEANGIKVK